MHNLTIIARFEAAAAVVIGAEGARSNDAGDPGGLTVYGHDQASWPDLLARVPADVRAQLPRNVSGLTRDQALLAYRAGYWDLVRGDDLPAPMALLVFDAAVNQGTGWAPAALQSVLGVTVDGDIGPETIQAAKEADTLETLAEFAWRRDQRYRQAGNWPTFGHGWITRLLRTVSLSLVYDDSTAQAEWLPHIGSLQQ